MSISVNALFSPCFSSYCTVAKIGCQTRILAGTGLLLSALYVGSLLDMPAILYQKYIG